MPEDPSAHDDPGVPERVASTIILNDRFIQSIGEDRLRVYVEILTDLAHRAVGGSTREVTKLLRHTLDSHGFPIPPIEAERLAEQLIRAGGAHVSITRGDGHVLSGPHPGVPLAEPEVDGDDDPEHQDRPRFS